MNLTTLPRSLERVSLQDLQDTLKARRESFQRMRLIQATGLASLFEKEIVLIESELQRREAAGYQERLFQ